MIDLSSYTNLNARMPNPAMALHQFNKKEDHFSGENKAERTSFNSDLKRFLSDPKERIKTHKNSINPSDRLTERQNAARILSQPNTVSGQTKDYKIIKNNNPTSSQERFRRELNSLRAAIHYFMSNGEADKTEFDKLDGLLDGAVTYNGLRKNYRKVSRLHKAAEQIYLNRDKLDTISGGPKDGTISFKHDLERFLKDPNFKDKKLKKAIALILKDSATRNQFDQSDGLMNNAMTFKSLRKKMHQLEFKAKVAKIIFRHRKMLDNFDGGRKDGKISFENLENFLFVMDRIDSVQFFGATGFSLSNSNKDFIDLMKKCGYTDQI